MRSLVIRLNSLTPNGRSRSRDAKQAALRGGAYPSYLSGTFTAWALNLH